MDKIYLLINGYTKEVVCGYSEIKGKEEQILKDINDDLNRENRESVKAEKIELNSEGEWRVNVVSNDDIEEDVSYYLIINTQLKV